MSLQEDRGAGKLYYWHGKVFSALRQASTMALFGQEISRSDVSRWQIYFMAVSVFLSLSSFFRLSSFAVDLKSTQKCHFHILQATFFKYRNIDLQDHKQLLILSCASNSRVNRDFFQNNEHQMHLINGVASATASSSSSADGEPQEV